MQSAELRGFAGQLGRLIWRFNVAVNRALVVYREPVLDMQLIQERIAGAAMELVRLNLRAQSLGFGVTGARAKWRSATTRFQRARIFSAQIDSARQEIVGGVER